MYEEGKEMKRSQYTVNRINPEDADRPIPAKYVPPPRITQLAKNPRPFERLKGIPNLTSVFSDKSDPSVHGHRLKRRKNHAEKMRQAQMRVIDEVQMEAFRKKNLAMEARDLQDLCRQFTLKAVETLIQILDDPDAAPSAKLQAINTLWDRGYGKPAQTQVNINASADTKPSELDAQSLDRRITDALSRVERLTNGETKETEGEKQPINIREYN